MSLDATRMAGPIKAAFVAAGALDNALTAALALALAQAIINEIVNHAVVNPTALVSPSGNVTGTGTVS